MNVRKPVHRAKEAGCRRQQSRLEHQPDLSPHQQHRALLRGRRCRAESAAGRNLGAVEDTAKG